MMTSKISRPASWANMEQLNGMPVPFVATRHPDGRIDLATTDPSRLVEVYERDLCHLCGQPIVSGNDGLASVLLTPTQLSCGIAVEPQGHFECIGHATTVCPHLFRGGRHIIATGSAAAVRRPVESVNDYVVALGAVRHVAVVERARTLHHFEIEDGDPQATNYQAIARRVQQFLAA